MKYRVIWDDCEDNRIGEPFEIEGDSLKDAYHKAEGRIKGLSDYLNAHFCSIDIECLVDEKGKYHNPDFFLNEENYEPKAKKDKRLVIVSGPSGVGKGPIVEWMKKMYLPDLCQVKVRKTPTPKHKGTENDLNFNNLSKDTYDFDCRGTKQIIDLHELDNALESHDAVLLEAYYKSFDFLKARYENSTDFIPTFISPLSKEEIKELVKQGKTLEDYLLDTMPNSLIERSKREGKVFTHSLIKELGLRAEDSANEMRFAYNYKKIIPNHCPESDARWALQNLIGEPKRVVDALYQIIQTGNSDFADDGSDYNFWGLK